MSLQSRVERLERGGFVPGPCWFCEWIDVGTQAFRDHLKARRIDPDAFESVAATRFCPLCRRERGVNVTGWTPADFELEDWYYREVATLDEGRIDAALARYTSRLGEIGAQVYGEHYAGAEAAGSDASKAWWKAHADDISDEDLEAVTRDPAEHRMVR